VGAGTVAPPFEPVAPAKRPFVLRAACDGRRLGLATPFADGVTELMRELGASWAPARRMWVCEIAGAKQLLAGLAAATRRWPVFSVDDARDTALAAWKAPTPDFFVSLLDVQVLPLERGGYALAASYDSLVVQAVKSLGGRFHRHAKAWEVHAERQEILQALEQIAGVTDEFVFQHEGQVVLEDLVAPPKAELPISVPGAPPSFGPSAGAEDSEGVGFLSAFGTPLKALPVDEKVLAAAAQACGLRGYQVDGVRHLIGHSSALLADDMGLGKTRQAVVAARMAAGADIVLVSCPASLTINWEREIRAVYPAARIAVIGQHSMSEVEAAEWVIANFERLGGLVRNATLRLAVLVLDECHYLKEHEAGRTRNAFLLSERVPRRMLLTGTPVLNREIELHTLLRLSGHPIGAMPLAEFRKQYAGDAARRGDLAGRLSEWMLRRGKDVLTDLGDKTQQVRYVKAADGLAGYRAIMADDRLQAMPKITKLRQHLESLKVEFLVESVQCLPQDAKVLIFAEYMDTVETLKHVFASEGIRCVSLVGSDSTKKRMAAVDAFQNDPEVKVLIGTTMAAGVGITLTAANYVFFASLPWTPALKRQAEDRAYRSGQKRDVFVIIPLVAETIDEQIFALLDSKREIEVALVESNRKRVSA
jgi:superfamily II DNA or RNA helicase